MKKIFTLFSALLLTINILAENSKTVTLEYPGTLSSKLSNSEKAELEKLTISGNIDARDFKLMRDALPKLKVLDISNTAIKAYNGPGGTEDGSTFYPANTVPKYAFNKTGILLETVKLSDDIVKIDENAFRENNKLKEINLPLSLTEIAAYAFRSCTSLKDIVIPDNVTTVKKSAFLQCSNISSVTFGSSVNSIESQAFFQNSNLIIVRSNASTPPVVANDAFSHTNIRIVLVPQADKSKYENANVWKNYAIGVEDLCEIHNPAAGGISNVINNESIDPTHITKLKITGNLNSADMTYIKANMNQLIDIDLSEASFVNNTVPAESFRNNFLLASVKLPESITHIGDHAFSGCTNISSEAPITANLKQIGNNSFYNCSKMSGSIKFPSSLQTIGDAAFNGCSSLNGEIKFANGLKTIGSQAFKSCSGLSGSLNIPETVTSVGTYAFQECSGLDGVLTLSPLMTSVSTGSFSSCENLSGALIIPESIKTIAGSAFYDCRNISTLELPSDLLSVGSSAFARCQNLEIIKVNASTPPTINANTFNNINKTTTELNVPEGKIMAYGAASYWKDFSNITDTAIEFETEVLYNTGGVVKEDGEEVASGATSYITLHASKTYEIIADEGYKIDFVKFNNVDVSNNVIDGVYTTPQHTQNSVLEVQFRQPYQYTVSITITGNGEIVYEDEELVSGQILTVNEESELEFTITPAYAAYIESVKFNTVNVTDELEDNTYSTAPIRVNSSLEVVFKNEYYISVDANLDAGSITANGVEVDTEDPTVAVSENSTVKFTITPNEGYIIDEVVYNGAPISISTAGKNGFEYTTAPVIQNGTLQVIFIPEPGVVSIKIEKNEGGTIRFENNTIENNGSVSIFENGHAEFTIIPNPGYALTSLRLNGVSVIDQMIGNVYKTDNLDSSGNPYTLKAVFERTQYILTVKDSESGSINFLFDAGAEAKFYIEPEDGWEVNTVMYNGTDITEAVEGFVYTLSAINSDATLVISYVDLTTSQSAVKPRGKIKIYSGPSELIIDGVDLDEQLIIYNIDGTLIYNQKTNREKMVIPVKKDSIYLINVEGNTYKVLI